MGGGLFRGGYTASRLTDAASLRSGSVMLALLLPLPKQRSAVKQGSWEARKRRGWGLIPAIMVISVDVEDLLALDTQHTTCPEPIISQSPQLQLGPRIEVRKPTQKECIPSDLRPTIAPQRSSQSSNLTIFNPAELSLGLSRLRGKPTCAQYNDIVLLGNVIHLCGIGSDRRDRARPTGWRTKKDKGG